MSIYFKTVGKKIKLPEPPAPRSSSALIWEITPRAGGWWIAECFEEKEGVRVSRLRKKIMFTQQRSQFSVQLGASTWFGDIIQERAGGGQSSGSESDLIAQFPGKVRKILVTENQELKGGEVLLLIEAMKMEFAIRAPSAGKVVRMRVSEGEQIVPGTQFLDWESLKNES